MSFGGEKVYAWQDLDEDREDVISTETWNGGDGTVLFNYLQQHPEGFDPPAVPSLIEEGDSGTTNPWNV